MRFLARDEDQVEVRLSVDELMLLKSALHEMCNGMQLGENDFQAILGAQRADAESLLRRIAGILDRLHLVR